MRGLTLFLVDGALRDLTPGEKVKASFLRWSPKRGDVDLKDVVESRAFLASLPSVGGSRVAVMGGSYGGYMVAAGSPSPPTPSTPTSTSSA